MTRFAAFLRGVNVGGVNLKMAEVAAALEKAGFTNVKTILASGNVLLDSRSGVDAVRKKAEKALRDEFGYDAWVLAYDLDTVRAISDDFRSSAKSKGTTATSRSSPTPTCSTNWPRSPRTPVLTRRSSAARASSTGRSPNKGTLDTTIGKTMGKKRYKSSTTTRNLRTLDKVLTMSKVDGSALTGVSETALMTLLVRANEARRPDSIIDDPMAIKLVDEIDFDFAKFGFTRRQDMAMRALTFDKYTRRYLIDHPSATVVALAEGLQTSFYRLDATGVGRPLPLAHRRSATDHRAARPASAALGPGGGVRAVRFGLQLDGSGGPVRRRFHHHRGPADVSAARRGARLDRRMRQAISRRADDVRSAAGVVRRRGSARGSRTSLRYRVPPMPFTLSPSEVADLANTVPGIRAVHDLPMAPGRGKVLNSLIWTLQRMPMLDSVRPLVTLLEFG